MIDHANCCGFCSEPPIGAIASIRICARHKTVIDAIAARAGLDPVTLEKVKRGRPKGSGTKRRKGLAT